MNKHEHCLLCDGEELVGFSGFSSVELVRCESCGLFFSAMIPSEEELVSHYEEWYSREITYNSPASHARREELLEELSEYRRSGGVLDIGCGTGLILDQAKARGWETAGVEFTRDAIETVRSRGHDIRQAPLEEAGFEPGTFDVAIYTEVIEHINNPREEVEAIVKHLRRGGVLYVTTPNFNALSRHVLGESWNVVTFPEHLTYYTPRTLCRLMEEAGLETVRCKSSGVSPTRLLRSLRGEAGGGARNHSSLDEQLRERVRASGRWRLAQRLVNAALHISGTGDSIKALFRRP